MTPIEKLQEKLNIEIDETYTFKDYDLEISTRTSADGYDCLLYTSDAADE